ncbi:MAG: RluA family pseudouridine synthase [Myxococcota bacterium]
MAKSLQKRTLDCATPRLDLVVQEMVGLSRAIVRGMFDHGCVRVNGAPCDQAGASAAAGAIIEVSWEVGRRYKEVPRTRVSQAFRVAYEDAHLIVVEKVAGVLTVPTLRGEQNTLVHEVAHHFSKSARITQRACIVHRLDRDTSGLLVFTRREDIAQALKQQFADHKPEREYAAIVAGRLPEDRGTFRSFLATDEDLDQYSTPDASEGKLAVTHYEVVERLRGATFVRVRLETGRRNQIRVHFAEAGHPVLGDVRYEVERARHPAWREKRLALHAKTLGFKHPVTGLPVRVTSELPKVFTAFLAATGLTDRAQGPRRP